MNQKLIDTIKMLIEAADSGEWHDSDDCRVEKRQHDCELCQALKQAQSILQEVASEARPDATAPA